jgi:hypothetical protein
VSWPGIEAGAVVARSPRPTVDGALGDASVVDLGALGDFRGDGLDDFGDGESGGNNQSGISNVVGRATFRFRKIMVTGAFGGSAAGTKRFGYSM